MRIEITKDLRGEQPTLWRGRGFVSNAHWAIRLRRLAAIPKGPLKDVSRSARSLVEEGRRFKVWRTGVTARSHGKYPAVEYSNARGTISIWVQTRYAHLIGLVGYTTNKEVDITDSSDPARWSVLVLAIRIAPDEVKPPRRARK